MGPTEGIDDGEAQGWQKTMLVGSRENNIWTCSTVLVGGFNVMAGGTVDGDGRFMLVESGCIIGIAGS